MIAKLLDSVAARPVYAAHELCHLLTARVLGISTQRCAHCTELFAKTIGVRVWLVTAAPLMFGWVFMAVFDWLAIVRSAWFIAPPVIVFNVCWQVLCLRDYSHCWHMHRYKFNPCESDLPVIPMLSRAWWINRGHTHPAWWR